MVTSRFLAGFVLALSLLAFTFCEAASFESGDLLIEKHGGGPPLILIPGLSSGPWVWETTVNRLVTKHTVYLITLPGFDGRAPRKDATLDSLQRDLLQLIESQQLCKPVLIGHSLGGTLSLAFATRHTTSIAGVIAVDGLAVFPGTENATDRQALAAAMRTQMVNQSHERFIADQQQYMRTIGSIDAETAHRLAELSSRSDPAAVAEFTAQLMMLDLRPQLPNIKVPVLVVSPFNAPDFARIGMDETRKSAYYARLLEGIPKLEIISISPARHFVMFDQPEKFFATIDRGLAQIAANCADSH